MGGRFGLLPVGILVEIPHRFNTVKETCTMKTEVNMKEITHLHLGCKVFLMPCMHWGMIL